MPIYAVLCAKRNEFRETVCHEEKIRKYIEEEIVLVPAGPCGGRFFWVALAAECPDTDGRGAKSADEPLPGDDGCAGDDPQYG